MDKGIHSCISRYDGIILEHFDLNERFIFLFFLQAARQARVLGMHTHQNTHKTPRREASASNHCNEIDFSNKYTTWDFQMTIDTHTHTQQTSKQRNNSHDKHFINNDSRNDYTPKLAIIPIDT